MSDQGQGQTQGPFHLDLVFSEGAVELWSEEEERTVTVRTERVGFLPTARLAIGDPFSSELAPVNSSTSLPERAEVVSLACSTPHEGVFETAALGLVFSRDAPVARWKPADLWVETDCGIGGFASGGTEPYLDDEDVAHALLTEFQTHEDSPAAVLQRPKAAFALSPSGYGDGAYQAHWALDADDRPLALVIDYDLLHQSVYREAILELPVAVKEHPELPGVTFKRPMLRRKHLVIRHERALGSYVYCRILQGGERVVPPVVGLSAEGMYDLSEGREGARLMVRLVTGIRELDRK